LVDKFVIYSLHEERGDLRSLRRILVLLLPCWALLACQLQERTAAPLLVADQTLPDPIKLAAKPAAPDWGRAGDCRAMLVLLRDGSMSGRIADLEGTPFALIDDGEARSGAFGFGPPGLASLPPSGDA
jgi:hypothetical protein